MKINKQIFTLLGILFIVMSCRKDKIDKTDIDNPLDPHITIETIVTGVIYDEKGAPVENAIISINEIQEMSNQHGVFSVNSVKLVASGNKLKIEKEGYFDNYRIIYPTAKEKNFLSIILTPKGISNRFDVGNGAAILMNGGAKVEFPPNAIVYDENGANYNGEVIVYAHWYDPTSSDLVLNTPASLEGFTSSGSRVGLSTFGMVAVEMETTTGDKLQLAPDKSAEITFPIPDEIIGEAKESIPLWYVDEETGLWNEEGTAIKVESSYVGKVNHFSFWNCDDSIPTILLEGRLVLKDGTPLSNIKVKLLRKGSKVNTTGYTYTNEHGVFKGKVPKSELLEMSVIECEKEIIIKDIGPFYQDIKLSNIKVDLERSHINIKAKVLGCGGINISESYAIITQGVKTTKVNNIDMNGYMDCVFSRCHSFDATIQFFDYSSTYQSEIINIESSLDVLDLGEILLCDENSYINFTIEGTTETNIKSPKAYIVNNSNVYIYFNSKIDKISFELSIPSINVGQTNATEMKLSNRKIYGANGIPLALSCGNYFPEIGIFPCDQFNVTISNIDNIGGYVSGTFDGILSDFDSTSTQERKIDGNFKVKIIRAYSESTVSGQIWYDRNHNGTRELSEENEDLVDKVLEYNIIDNYISYSQGSFDYGYHRLKYAPIIEGKYKIEHIIPEINTYFQIGYKWKVVKATRHEPNKNAKDNNDFKLSGFPQGADTYHVTTGFIDFDENQHYQNLDFGFKLVSELSGEITNQGGCSKSTTTLLVKTDGGVPPFYYELSDGQSKSTTVDSVLFNVNFTQKWECKVTDLLGREVNIKNNDIATLQNSVIFTAWVDVPGGRNNLYDKDIDELIPLYGVNGGKVWVYNFKDELVNIPRGSWTKVPLGDYYMKIKVPDGYSLLPMDRNNIHGSIINPSDLKSDFFEVDCKSKIELLVGLKKN